MSCKIEFRGVSLKHGTGVILNDVSFTLEPGGVLVFGGRSGQGKSSLLEICAGLVKPSGGAVLWDGDDIAGMPKYELYGRRKSAGYVFQVHALISNHSVFDNIALPLRCGTNLTGEQIRKRVWAQMEELGISRDIERKFPEALSAAQLRSAAIARALVNNPTLLILDEPLSGIDPVTAGMIIKVLHERWKTERMSVIMATHSLSAWPDWSAKRFMLKDGRFAPADEAFAPARDLRFNQRYVHAK